MTTSVFDQHGRRLFGVAYRMLGSVVEAEDAVQEAFVRFSEADEDQINDPAAWLTTVVSRICIDRLRSAQHRRETYVGPWLPEPLLVDGADPADEVEMYDTLSMAFLVVLETLSPEERVAFLLHDVFAVPFEQVADVLGKSPAASRQLAARARQRLADGRPRFDPDPAVRNKVADAFLAACAGEDLAGVVSLLAPDVVLTSDGGGVVSAARRPVVGADAVARFLVGLVHQGADLNVRMRRVVVNGQPGAVIEADGHAPAVMSVAISEGRITSIEMVSTLR